MDRQQEYKFENKMKDCLAYFRLSPVWEKVLKGFREDKTAKECKIDESE